MSQSGSFRFARRLGLLAYVALFLLSPALAAAQEANPYVVSGIQVDVTAENAVAAREKALAEGARQALQVLVERTVPADRQARVPKLSPARIEGLVQDVSISQEKASATRYIATLNYTFNRNQVRRVLGSPVARTGATAAVSSPASPAAAGTTPVTSGSAIDPRTAAPQPRPAAPKPQAAKTPVVAVVKTLDEWLEIQKRIKQVDPVRQWELVMLSPVAVRINLVHTGGVEQVAEIAAEEGLAMSREGAHWVMSLAPITNPFP